ncbi:putative secreted protein [Dissostichus eleginoides]|uniref:Secreted protein n=1 Tax=Dissostichus eleginoides TaxID=100907 RepID=A0AAD9BBQ8_DISEL|nr:putative secreted protein [Dissostichus eleginoides]
MTFEHQSGSGSEAGLYPLPGRALPMSQWEERQQTPTPGYQGCACSQRVHTDGCIWDAASHTLQSHCTPLTNLTHYNRYYTSHCLHHPDTTLITTRRGRVKGEAGPSVQNHTI